MRTALDPALNFVNVLRERSGDDALRGGAIGVGRSRRNVGFAFDPLMQFGIGFADVARERVSAASFIGGKVMSGCWLFGSGTRRSASQQACEAETCNRYPSPLPSKVHGNRVMHVNQRRQFQC